METKENESLAEYLFESKLQTALNENRSVILDRREIEVALRLLATARFGRMLSQDIKRLIGDEL